MTTGQEIAKRDGARALAIPTGGEGGEGLSGTFGREDIAIPVGSLSQAQSQDKGEPGRFWFPSGESLETMETVVLDIVATRGMWDAFGEGSKGLICRSNDRQMGWTEDASEVLGKAKAKDLGLGDGEVTIPCDMCPHAKDATDFTSNDKDPKCRLGYTLTMYEVEMKSVFLYFVKGTQVKPVKQRIVSPALFRLRQDGKAAPWTCAYTWTVKPVTGPSGKYFVPEIQPQPPFDDQVKDQFADMAAEYVGSASRQTLEENPDGQSAMLPNTD